MDSNTDADNRQNNFRSYYGNRNNIPFSRCVNGKDEKTSVFVDGLYEGPPSGHSINTQNFSATDDHQQPVRTNKGVIPLHFSPSSVMQPNVAYDNHSCHATRNEHVIYGRNTGSNDRQTPSNGHYQKYPQKTSFNHQRTCEQDSLSRTNYLMQYSKALYSVQNDLLTREATLRSKAKMANHLTQSRQTPSTTTNFYNSNRSNIPLTVGSYDQRTKFHNKLQYERNLGPIDLWYRDLYSCNNPKTNSCSFDVNSIYPSHVTSREQRCISITSSYQQRLQQERHEDASFQCTKAVKCTTNSPIHTTDTDHLKNKPKENTILTYAQFPAKKIRDEHVTQIPIDFNKNKTLSNKEENENGSIVKCKFGNDNVDVHGKCAFTGKCSNKNINEEMNIMKKEIADEKHSSSRSVIVFSQTESTDSGTDDSKDTTCNMKDKGTVSRILSEDLRKKQFSPKQRMLKKFRCENEMCDTDTNSSSREGIQVYYIINSNDNNTDRYSEMRSNECSDGSNESLNQTCITSIQNNINNNFIPGEAVDKIDSENRDFENENYNTVLTQVYERTIPQKAISAKLNSNDVVNQSLHPLESSGTIVCPTDNDLKNSDTVIKGLTLKPVITHNDCQLSNKASTISLQTEEDEGHTLRKHKLDDARKHQIDDVGKDQIDDIEKHQIDDVEKNQIDDGDGRTKPYSDTIVNESLLESKSDTCMNASGSNISITVAESISDIFNESTTSKQSEGNTFPSPIASGCLHDVASSSNDRSINNYSSEIDLAVKSIISNDENSITHSSENTSEMEEHQAVTVEPNQEEKRFTDYQDSFKPDESNDVKCDSHSIQVTQEEILQTYQDCTRENGKPSNTVGDSHQNTDNAFIICDSESRRILTGYMVNESTSESSQKETHSNIQSTVDLSMGAQDGNRSSDIQEIDDSITMEKINSPKSVYYVQEDIDVGNVIQIGQDSFYDSIETGESTLYQTCIDYEQNCVDQTISSDKKYENEHIQYVYDSPPLPDPKINNVKTDAFGSLTTIHSGILEDLQSRNVKTNSIGLIPADTLEDNILQHLNKTIEIVTRTPPQTVDSVDVIQIKKNLECLSQRIESAPLDEKPLSYSRNVIWDVLQLCGSCMILSQVALDRIRSCMGQTVKHQLGFYPDMFIDTLTILFKQASIASSMASNISEDLFFDSSANNKQSQHEETNNLAKEENSLNLTIHKGDHSNKTCNNEESNTDPKVDKTAENNTQATNTVVQEHNGNNSNPFKGNDDLTHQTVTKSQTESENEAQKSNSKETYQMKEDLSLKLTKCRTNDQLKSLRTDSLDLKSNSNTAAQKSEQSEMLAILKENKVSVKKHQGNVEALKRFKTSKDKWKAKLSSKIGTKITFSNKSILRQNKYRHEYNSVRRQQKLRNSKDKMANNSNKRHNFSTGVSNAKIESAHTRTNFTNSRSCRRLKQDLFDLHGHNVPSSIVLNYNEPSQFCCHVVLTRTPLLYKRPLSRDHKRPSSNHRISKSNSNETGCNKLQRSQPNQNIGLNRSVSDSNLNTYFENGTKDENFSFKSDINNEHCEHVDQPKSDKTEVLPSFNIGRSSSCCNDSTANGLSAEIKLNNNLNQTRLDTPDIQMECIKSAQTPTETSVKTNKEEISGQENNQPIREIIKCNKDNFEMQRSIPSMIINNDVLKTPDKIRNDTERLDFCATTNTPIEFPVTANKCTDNISDNGTLNVVSPEDLEKSDFYRHTKRPHNASSMTSNEKENIIGNKENFASRNTGAHDNINRTFKTQTKIKPRDFRKMSFEEEISKLDFSDIKVKSPKKHKGLQIGENTPPHKCIRSKDTKVINKEEERNDTRRDISETHEFRQTKTNKCGKMEGDKTEHDDGSSPMKIKRMDSDYQDVKRSSEKDSRKRHYGHRTVTIAKSKQDTKVKEIECLHAMKQHKTGQSKMITKEEKQNRLSEFKCLHAMKQHRTEQSNMFTKEDTQNELSGFKTTSHNIDGCTNKSGKVVVNENDTISRQVQNAKKEDHAREVNQVRQLVVDTPHKDSNKYKSFRQELIISNIDVKNPTGHTKVKRTLSYHDPIQEHYVSPIKKQKSSTDQFSEIGNQRNGNLEKTYPKLCRSDAKPYCKENTQNVEKTLSIAENCKLEKDKLGSNTSNKVPDSHRFKSTNKSNYRSQERNVDEYNSKSNNRNQVSQDSSASRAKKESRERYNSSQSNNDYTACEIRRDSNQNDRRKKSNSSSVSCCVMESKNKVNNSKQSKRSSVECSVKEDKNKIDNHKQLEHSSLDCCSREDRNGIVKNKSATNNEVCDKYSIREGKDVTKHHTIAPICTATGTNTFKHNINDGSMQTKTEFGNKKRSLDKNAVKDTTNIKSDAMSRTNYAHAFEDGTKQMGNKKTCTDRIRNEKICRSTSNEKCTFDAKEKSRIVDNGRSSLHNVDSAVAEKKCSPPLNAKFYNYAGNSKDYNSKITDRISSKHDTKSKHYKGAHDSKRVREKVDSAAVNNKSSNKQQVLKDDKELEKTFKKMKETIEDNRLDGCKAKTVINQKDDRKPDINKTVDCKTHKKQFHTSDNKIRNDKTHKKHFNVSDNKIRNDKTHKKHFNKSDNKINNDKTRTEEHKIDLKCVTKDHDVGQVSPKYGGKGDLANVSVVDNSIKMLEEKNQQAGGQFSYLTETFSNDESSPTDIDKRDIENYSSYSENNDDDSSAENPAASRNWLKLSDIYNTAPIESSDDEKDQQREEDIMITNAVYSPLRFDTESADELPALSLPNKGKQRWKGVRRCHRVDSGTHFEIQKILKEIIPSVPSNNTEETDSDDDDAKTVTDFSYLSEPQQNVKLKSKKRWNKISFTSNKPQIYSQQEYLSAACGGIKHHDLNRREPIDKVCPNVSQSISEDDDRSSTRKRIMHAGSLKTDKEIIPTFRKRGLTCVKECFAVLDKVYNHEQSDPFRHEVKSKDVPDYYKIIKRGMCYDMIAHKLRDGIYRKLEEFVDDMKLVFSNCFQYHDGGSETYLAGVEVQAFFENKMYETFPNIDVNFNRVMEPKMKERLSEFRRNGCSSVY